MQKYDEKCFLLATEAAKWVGVVEKGPNKGPDVERFQKAVDGKASGEAWCMCFVQFCVDQVDALLKGSKHTPTWLFQSEHCLTVWNKTPQAARIPWNQVQPGCLIVWQHFKDGKATTSGHVGIVIRLLPDSINGSRVETIEGNTGNGAGVVREGDGVYRRVRSLAGSDTMKVKGFLRCWNPTK